MQNVPIRPRSLTIGLVVSLTMVALLAGCNRSTGGDEPIRAVRTTVVESSNVSGQQEFAAEVRARTESRLGFRVGGKLVRRHVDVGESVRAGQVLAQLDAQDLRLGQEAAQATLAAARVNLELMEAEFKRFKELREQGFISGMELDRREAALKAARAQAEQVRAQASVQGNQTSYATLQADAPGVVTAVDVEPGAVVAAGMPILRLAHDGPRDVAFAVPEDRVTLVRALLDRRDAVQVRLWGQADLLPATVREVAAAADPATRTFAVKADIGAAAVRLGQTASVLIRLPAADGVIRLPLSAVFEQQGKSHVWLLERSSMTVRQRRVQVAGADGNDVLVTDGVLPGQVVVTAGVHALAPGQKVKLFVDPAAPAAAGPGARPASAVPAPAASDAR
ncbi:MAG: efflux RND transporter periplasmic adaptor subunit [Aquabacterium sp.]|jgi:RND family efflux transporter MFP subunit|nr:efflux RND transporter periplasmic adaptor subunit [Aquabacterium sp.]